VARIALDIDSTLHHYWDLLAELSQRHYGVDLPYSEQRGWGIDRLQPEQLQALVAETHSESNILAAEPYPGAVETVREWHAAGHWIHITSHRATASAAATARWLEQIEMPFDDLHCSYDKVTRCVELGIHVLVDDSPVNLERAAEEGIVGATITHPWNEELVAKNGVIGAEDWPALRELLAPLLARHS
jgi:uncharacterized HAD superfamily protein